MGQQMLTHATQPRLAPGIPAVTRLRTQVILFPLTFETHRQFQPVVIAFLTYVTYYCDTHTQTMFAHLAYVRSTQRIPTPHSGI